MKFRIREVQEVVLDTKDDMLPLKLRDSLRNADANDVAELSEDEGLDYYIELLGPERLQLRRSLDVDLVDDAKRTPATTIVGVLSRYREFGSLNEDEIKILVDAVENADSFAQAVDAILQDAAESDFVGQGSLRERLEQALDTYIEIAGAESCTPEDLAAMEAELALDEGRFPGPATDAQGPYRTPQAYSGQDMVGDPGPWEAQVEPSYDIEIVDQGFEPAYGGWNFQFKAIGLPRLSYQKQDPILDAYVKLERAEPDAPKLAADSTRKDRLAGGSALARSTDEKLADVMMGGGTEGQILRGFSGAAVVESAPVVVGNAPVALPSQERIAEACRAAIAKHLEAVEEERKRLAVTESSESVVGRKMKV